MRHSPFSRIDNYQVGNFRLKLQVRRNLLVLNCNVQVQAILLLLSFRPWIEFLKKSVIFKSSVVKGCVYLSGPLEVIEFGVVPRAPFYLVTWKSCYFWVTFNLEYNYLQLVSAETNSSFRFWEHFCY